MLAVAACANHGTSAAGPIDSFDAQAVDAREAGSGDGDMAPPPRDAPSEMGPPDPGSAGGAGGSGTDRGSSQPSPPVMIALLPAVDALRPFQHAAEVSVAALGDDVVVSAINIHTDGPDTLEASELLRQVGVAVSHDGGDTFAAPVNPGFTNAETSDPVVRVTRDGSFWLAAMGIDEGGNRGLLLRSQDGGRDFAMIHDDLRVFDKEWIAASPGGGLVLGGEGGLWRFAEDGRITASWADGGFDWTVFGAFDDDEGAHFSTDHLVYSWTGDMGLGGGVHLFQSRDPSAGWSVPVGRTAGGELWAIYGSAPYADSAGIAGDIRMVLFSSDSDMTGETITISTAGETAFMPAAAQDDDGRVHVLWYDSSGTAGVLKYARSVSSDPRDGFTVAAIVDPNACPGGRWYPHFSESEPPPGTDRRLREYVDLSISRRRVHMAWTHAPALPSRILVSHLDF